MCVSLQVYLIWDKVELFKMAALGGEEWKGRGDGHDEEDEEDDDLWDDVDEEMIQDTPVKCLFCDEVFPSPSEVLNHCKEKESFDLLDLSTRSGITSSRPRASVWASRGFLLHSDFISQPRLRYRQNSSIHLPVRTYCPKIGQ